MSRIVRRFVRFGRERRCTEPALLIIVVAGTSPINYPILIGKIDLLKELYMRILVPTAVLAELKHPFAPKPVQDRAANTPAWVEVVNPKSSLIPGQLDPGERARRSRLLSRSMPMSCLWTNRPGGRKPFAED